MTEDVSALTIDFATVFSGVAYPKDTETIILNEALGYRANKVQAELRNAELLKNDEETQRLQSEFDAIREEASAYTYTFHLTGVSREIREDVAKTVRDEFQVETDMFGNIKTTPEMEKAYRARELAVHTEKIVGPGGIEVVAPTPENLLAFVTHAPDQAILALNKMFTELDGLGSSKGFDAILRDADFLSKR